MKELLKTGLFNKVVQLEELPASANRLRRVPPSRATGPDSALPAHRMPGGELLPVHQHGS